MATITAADLTALAEAIAEASADLAKTGAQLEQHIARRAQEIATERSKSYAKAADERIAEVTKQAADEIQRRDDLIAELRRQFTKQIEKADRGREAQRKLDAVRTCKTWIDDLGRKYVFADELCHATDPEHFPPPTPARIQEES